MKQWTLSKNGFEDFPFSTALQVGVTLESRIYFEKDIQQRSGKAIRPIFYMFSTKFTVGSMKSRD